MTSKQIIASPLTREAFAPYGDVIETSDRDSFMINSGQTERFHDLAKLETDIEGKVIVSIFRAEPTVFPLTISMLEKHPLGCQAFIPLNKEQFLVVVADANNPSQVETVKAFLSNGNQGINYHRNVWHHPVIALNRQTDFLVIDRSGPGNNCEEYYFDQDNTLTTPNPHPDS